MKPIAALFAGFLGSLALFGSGAVVAVYFLVAQPPEEGAPSGDVGGQRRLATLPGQSEWPARQIEIPAPDSEVHAPASGEGRETGESGASATMVDEAATASIGAATQTAPAGEAGPPLSQDHMDWCANRYRSYRPRDDSYTPYSGGRQRCVSPYSQALDQRIPREVSPPPSVADDYATDETLNYPDEGYIEAGAASYISAEHVDYCFSRYRSYRPEDNSYQPYGGGPRLQCE